VLFVEDSEDLREMFVELVDFALNRRCIGVGSYEELVALGDRALGCGPAKRKGDAEIVSKPIDPERLQSVIDG